MGTKPLSVHKTLELRDKLQTTVLDNYIGALMVADLFLQISLDVNYCLGKSIESEVVINSMRPSVGLELTRERAAEIAWRLAGNMHRLRSGEPVMPWREQTEKEWAPVEIVDVTREFRNFKASTPEQAALADGRGMVRRRGATVSLLFQGGLPAGRIEKKFWSWDYCQRIRVELGFDRFNRIHNSRHFTRRANYLFLDIRELFGRRFQVLLNPELCRPGELAFSEIDKSDAGQRWNHELHKKRMRIDFACPRGYPDDHDCFICPIGLDACSAACHQVSFTKGNCAACENEKYFDLAKSSELCVDCLAAGR